MTFRKKCLSCNKPVENTIIDLGMHSFADRFIEEKDFSNSDPAYPLSILLCKNCGFIQNKIQTNPEDRYQEVEYSYTASNSDYAVNHWYKYAEEILDFSKNNPTNILEIGSNDGTLLEGFLNVNPNLNVLGIDASPKMVELANSKKINSHCGIFGNEELKVLENKKFDIICANNVLNHSENPRNFLKSASKYLKDNNSFIVFELPYWKYLVDDGRFDQIYHEHVCYFTAENSQNLLSKIGLEIIHLETNSYHGGSLRVYCSKLNNLKVNKSVENFLLEESFSKLNHSETYKNLIKKINKNRSSLLKKILNAKEEGRKIICVGAAAKANTFLTYYGLDSTIIDFITDASDHKIGKYTPLTRIPIKPDESIAKYDYPICLVTTWNIGENLKKIIFKYNPNAKILMPH